MGHREVAWTFPFKIYFIVLIITSHMIALNKNREVPFPPFPFSFSLSSSPCLVAR